MGDGGLRGSASLAHYSEMNLLHVTGTMDPAWGGPVEGLANLTRQAHLRGHDAEIVCLDVPAAPWLRNLPVKVTALGPAHYGQFGYSRLLDRWLEAHLGRFDAVIVNGIWMYFSAAARRASLAAGIPYFLFTHGALDPWFKQRYPLKHLKKAAYWLLCERKVMRDAAAVLFTTREEKELAENAFWPYECNPQVTGYGIEDPLPAQELETSSQTARQQIEEIAPELRGHKFILFLARLHEKKGIELLLEAISRTRQNAGDYRFVIAGPGNPVYTAQLKAVAAKFGVQDLTVWGGPLYGSAKWAALRSAEAFVLPSHQENFGLSIAEALACAVPVLITRKVNIWREINAGEAGFVENDDASGVTRLLERWFSLSSEAALVMRARARQCFLTHFEITTASNRFFGLVESVRPERAGVACAC